MALGRGYRSAATLIVAVILGISPTVSSASPVIEMTLTPNQATYLFGELISIAVTLHNRGPEAVPVTAIPQSVIKAKIKKIEPAGATSIRPTKGMRRIELLPGAAGYSATMLEPGDSATFTLAFEFSSRAEAHYELTLLAGRPRNRRIMNLLEYRIAIAGTYQIFLKYKCLEATCSAKAKQIEPLVIDVR